MLLLVFACAAPDDDGAGLPPGERPPLDGDADTDTDTDTDTDADTDTDTDTDVVDPPLRGTSGGSGGADAATGTTATAGGVTYGLLAPAGSARGSAVPLLLVVSGVEGREAMLSNMSQVAPYYGLDDAIVAVLDGRTARAVDGAAVLDAVRAAYDVDNDRTWLLSESAGTAAGLELAFEERPSWFAAYWANDVNDRAVPTRTAAELGFVPWGNAGPGGDLPDAEAIVAGMRDAGWQLPSDAPYSGAGSGSHGSTEQFLAAVDFFADKSRE